jgi:hypothetical protein
MLGVTLYWEPFMLGVALCLEPPVLGTVYVGSRLTLGAVCWESPCIGNGIMCFMLGETLFVVCPMLPEWFWGPPNPLLSAYRVILSRR